MSGDPITWYVAELGRRLESEGLPCGRFLTEVEDHLREALADLKSEGVAADVGVQTVLARFGDLDEITAAFLAAEHEAAIRRIQTEEPMIRMLLVVLAAFNAIAALFFVSYTAVVPDGGAAWVAWKLTSSGLALLAAVVGGLAIVGNSGRLEPLVLPAALALVAFGAVTAGTAFLLGHATGDYEFYLVPVGLALFAQGVGLAVWDGPARRSAATH